VTSNGEAVHVEAHARLHFGVLDLRGSLGRWFGGIGAAAPAPMLRLSARKSETVTATGPDAERALKYANRLSDLLFVVARVLAREESGQEIIWDRKRLKE